MMMASLICKKTVNDAKLVISKFTQIFAKLLSKQKITQKAVCKIKNPIQSGEIMKSVDHQPKFQKQPFEKACKIPSKGCDSSTDIQLKEVVGLELHLLREEVISPHFHSANESANT